MKLNILLALLFSATNLFASVDFQTSGAEYVKGEYVVKFVGSKSLLSNKQIEQNLGVEVVKSLSKSSNAVLVRTSLAVKSAQALADLNANPMVEYAEPNYIYTITSLPNDPELEQLWGLRNVGQADPKGGRGVAGFDVNAEKAWELTTGSKEVVVAVIDTGVDHSQPDLKNNMWVNEAEANGEEGVDDDGNGYVDDIYGYDFVNKDGDPMDDHAHGTHVAGTIAAEGNNEQDIVGVAWKAKIMGVKFLSGSGSGTLADAVLAIDYATSNGAHLSNNSWGGGGFSQALADAIQRAADANSLFVAAAGNSNVNNDAKPHYPSSYEHDNVVAVAAINNKGLRASFSCWGKTSVDLGAPGRNILSTTPSGLKSFSGTSMATPHVSGAVVLLMSHEPGLAASEIRERLIRTAKPINSMTNKVVSGGMLDAHALLTNTIPPPNPNDPNNWETEAISVSSAHPYANDTAEEYEIQLGEEVTQMAVYFEKFETEANYDKVKLYNAAGEEVADLSGNHDGSFSPVVSGNYVKLVFTSDNIINKYGFDATKVAVKRD